MILDANLLSLAIWTPIVGGVVVLATGNDKKAPLARILALLVSLLTFAITLPLYTQFDAQTADMQFLEMVSWIPAFSINYALGIDGIALLLILLTSFTTIIVVISAWKVIQENVAQYMAAFLIIQKSISFINPKRTADGRNASGEM